MSLEQALAENTAAIKLLTAAIAGAAAPAGKSEKPKAEAGKAPPPATPEQTAATAPADTQTTAEQAAAPAEKAATSAEKTAPSTALSVDERTTLVRELAFTGRRDVIEGLLAKFGVAKVSQLDAEQLVQFDAQLVAAKG